MVIMGVIQVVGSAIGAYNLVKGAYNMYCDAEVIKNQYRQHQRIVDEYRDAQTEKHDILTDSQFHRYENEFLVVNESMIIDPFKVASSSNNG